MLDAEVVPTEYTRGSIGGVDYGSKARVVLRSPNGFIFVALGVHYIPRNSHSYHDIKTVCEKANADNFSDPKVRARIVEWFGEGADEAVLKTTEKRGHATVLWQGGGKKLPLPHHEANKLHSAAYAEASPTRDILPENVECCLQCGKPLALKTIKHSLGWDSRATTVEELQRLTNLPIVRVRGFESNRPDLWQYIESFETWDGESYSQETFCSDRCAAIYGRRAAAELAKLPTGGEPPAPKPWVPDERIAHYDVKAEAERSRRAIEKSFERTHGPNSLKDFKGRV
jgi:hypothetical protein